MHLRVHRLALLVCALALVASLSACGGSSKKKAAPPKPFTTGSTTATASDKAAATAAVAPWKSELAKVVVAFRRYGVDEPAHARQHNLLAERRDAYDLRNGVYRFDLAVRKIKFPSSMQDDVNSLLTGTGRLVSALDGMSQSSKVEDVNRFIKKSNGINLTPLAAKISKDLSALSGQQVAQPSSSAGSSEASKLAAALLKYKSQTGAKSTADAACAAKLMLKDVKSADAAAIESGNIPKSGRLYNEIGASLLACQAGGG